MHAGLHPASCADQTGEVISSCACMQILGYFLQGLICLVYMPLCFQLSRFTDEAASRIYADLGKDIDAGEVPEIASAKVPAGTRLFYVLSEVMTLSYCFALPAEHDLCLCDCMVACCAGAQQHEAGMQVH